jgi:hypothetical protein
MLDNLNARVQYNGMNNTTDNTDQAAADIAAAMDLWNQIMDIAKANTTNDEDAFQMAAAEMNRRMGL